jgi:mono/diheme cytochrome c family protein
MKKFAVIILLAVFAAACGGNSDSNTAGNETPATDAKKNNNGNPSYDPERGEGKFTEVKVGATLDAAMAADGEKIYSVKCSSCHKLTSEKLVGPGWLGVTERHAGPWIMNFITNTDAMLSKDPKAQAQLEICLVRMPNQNLTDENARALYEFQRKNDGVK